MAAALVAQLAFLIPLSGGTATAAPGSLDPSFGSGGSQVSTYAAPDTATGVAVLQGGQIAVSGGNSGQFELSLYSSNGAPAGAPWPISFPGTANAVTASGSNVVAAGGVSTSGGGACSLLTPFVTEYSPTGSLVAGFPVQVACPTGATSAYFNGVTVEPNGTIVAAGTELVNGGAVHETFVAWIAANGTSGGTPTTQAISSQSDGLSVVAPVNGGDAYVAGDSSGLGSLAAVATTGLDTSFNSPSGLRTFSSTIQASGIAVGLSGALVVDGAASPSGGFLSEVSRSTGAFVNTFGTGGTVTTTNLLSAVAYQALGNIINVAGTSGSGNASQMMLEQFGGTEGQINSSFGSGGILTTAFPGPASATSAATQADGKVVAAGGAPGITAGNTSLSVIRALGPSVTVTATAPPPIRLLTGPNTVPFHVSLDEPLFSSVSVSLCATGGLVNGAATCGSAAIAAGQTLVSVPVTVQVTAYPQNVTLSAQPGGGVAPSTTAGSATVQILQPAWSGWLGLGAVPPPGMAGGSSPAVASWAPGRLDLFAEGADAALWHRWSTDGGVTWSGWENLGGGLIGGPAAVSWAANRIDVFVRGFDNQLWHKWWDGSSWSGWEPLGGGLTSAPAVSSWAAGRLDVFVDGGGGAIFHKWYDGGWSGWENLGGVGRFSPAAVSWAAGRIDLFTVGTDGRMYHQVYAGGWSGWFKDFFLTFASGPAVSTWGPWRLDMFAASSSPGNPMTHVWFDGAWHAESLGGALSSGPAGVSWGYPRIDTFVQGTDHKLWYQWYGTSFLPP